MAAITEQLEEARIESNEVIQTAAMWENLANRAVQIPPVSDRLTIIIVSYLHVCHHRLLRVQLKRLMV